MKRRTFIAGLGSAAAWPWVARAQQPAMPVIGFLQGTSIDANMDILRAFRQGLKEAGYVEGENVAIEYRFADEGGNLTGINFFTSELSAKRLEVLRELVPGAVRVAVLLNPAYATIAESILRDIEPAARAMGLQIQVLNADTRVEIDAAFATFERERPDALFVGPGPFFGSRRVQMTQWAARSAVPAIYAARPYVEVGGLASYGTSRTDSTRQQGIYVARILKGAKPAGLPVVQSTKFELVINAQTARMLGLTVPQTLLATADEVIQ